MVVLPTWISNFLVLSALLLQELLPWQRGRDLCFSVSCRVDLQCGRELWEAGSTRFRRVLYLADQVLGVAVGPVTGPVWWLSLQRGRTNVMRWLTPVFPKPCFQLGEEWVRLTHVIWSCLQSVLCVRRHQCWHMLLASSSSCASSLASEAFLQNWFTSLLAGPLANACPRESAKP